MAKHSSDRPQQRYATGEPGKVHGRDGVGIIEGSCGYRARGDQYSGIICFIEKPRVQDDRGRHVAKRSSDPPPQQRYATGEPDKVQGRDHVAIVEGSSG